MGVGRCHKLCGLGGEITSLAGYIRYTGCLKSGRGGENCAAIVVPPGKRVCSAGGLQERVAPP